MAAILWFIILNFVDPIRTVNIPVPLELRNHEALAAGETPILLGNINDLQSQTIYLRMRGNSRIVEELRTNLTAYIDLAASDIIVAAGNREALPVMVQIENFGDEVELLSVRPLNVTLLLDNIITREMPVEVTMQGNVHQDFWAPPESVSVTPATVTVTGPSSVVSGIQRLDTLIHASGRTSTIHVSDNRVRPIGLNNVVINNPLIEINARVAVEVPIFRRGILEINPPIYNFEPPPGFGVYNIEFSPQYFNVAGDTDVIFSLEPINLDDIPEEFSTHTTPFEVSYNINHYLPSRVFLIESNQHTVNVNVVMEPIVERAVRIDRTSFNVQGMPPNTIIVTDEIVLNISALASVMETVTPITATARLFNSNFAEGEHEVPLTFGLPPRVSIVGEAPTLTIYARNPEADDTEVDFDIDEEVENDTETEDEDEEVKNDD